MIDLYTWTTPNGRKVSILLEELGLPYEAHAVDITAGAQKAAEFLAVSPNGKIPAIRDRDSGFTLMELGAILLWLATRAGRFVAEGDEHWRMVEWLMWQMAGLGPMLGQVHHFAHFNPGRAPYAETRYRDEAARLYGVLEARLARARLPRGCRVRPLHDRRYCLLAMGVAVRMAGDSLGDYPNVRDWYLRIADRPAVERGYHVPHRVADIPRP